MIVLQVLKRIKKIVIKKKGLKKIVKRLKKIVIKLHVINKMIVLVVM